MCDYEAEIQRLTALYDEVQTPDACEDSEEEEEGGDIVVTAEELVSEHETDTEQEDQEDTDEEDKTSTASQETSRSLYFFGKDGTKWRKHAPPQNIRTRRHNIVTHLPGVLGHAKNALTPIHCWLLFFEDILNIIVVNTNLYINKISPRYRDRYDVTPTDIEEIKAFIGLLYLADSQYGGRKNLKFLSKMHTL